MYRESAPVASGFSRFPHRRGGVPQRIDSLRSNYEFSPQAWGCTESLGMVNAILNVFPTGVGVYRARVTRCGWASRFSPQAWGCTADRKCWLKGKWVFPTGVGVYRRIRGLAGVCGVFPTGVGVYRAMQAMQRAKRRFSPQAWGCTGAWRPILNTPQVFPTGVGVYRLDGDTARPRRPFSPQAWGCTGLVNC